MVLRFPGACQKMELRIQYHIFVLRNFGVFVSEVMATFMSYVKFRLLSINYKMLGLNLDSF